jgi:hypothetical protein
MQPFDETEYREDFLKKHRGSPAVSSDLISRYMITLPATDAEIAARIRARRAYWNKIYPENSLAAQIAKLCRAEDQRLHAEYGAAMETSAWWQQQQSERQSIAEASVTTVAADLQQHFGHLGVVTKGTLDKFSARLGLTNSQAEQAAQIAGLSVIPVAPLPDGEPIWNFTALLKSMSACGAASVPDLVHPGSGPYSIIDRYVCREDPGRRLDEDALAAEIAKAATRGISAAANARVAALRILRAALLSGVNLRDIALYHLIKVAKDAPSTNIAAALRETGLEPADAGIIEVLMAEQNAVAGLSRTGNVAVPGMRISAGHTREELVTVPLAAPAPVHVVFAETAVSLRWLPGPDHTEDTVYTVRRTQGRSPATPADGVHVYRGGGGTCTDPHVPVAREVQYGVFAAGGNRPSSEPATTSVTLLPPVSRLTATASPDSIALHWYAHPEAEVRVIWTAPGAPPAPLPVTGNSHQLTGLAEGRAHHFEVTAIYSGPDGAELRSVAEHISVIPRAPAQPVQQLRAFAVEAGGAVRVRVSWAPVDNSEVRILRSDVPQPWPAGAVITVEEMTEAGQEITGGMIPGQADPGFETALPAGVHYLVPVSIGGTGLVAGRGATVAVIDPVRHLDVMPFATYATVSWEWPSGCQFAELRWELDGSADAVIIGREQYRSEGGARVPLGREPCTIEVRAMITSGGTDFTSPPVCAAINATVAALIGYEVSRIRSSRTRRRVVFSCEHACRDAGIRMVASAGPVMPTDAASGEVILDETLALEPGVPVEREVTIPSNIHKPFWVRCFVVTGQARLIDPPVSCLKET